MRCRCWLGGLLVMLAAGCGRIGFELQLGSNPDGSLPRDASWCTAHVHDEDGDGYDDSCDVCPHLPDPAQGDGDGDGVGDTCDPEPTNPRQTLALFDPFTNLDAAWNDQFNAALGSDELVLSGDGGAAWLGRPHSTGDLVTIRATTGTMAASGDTIVGIFFGQGMLKVYCELLDRGGATILSFTTTSDGATYTQIDTEPLSARVGNGTGRLTIDMNAATTRCDSDFHDEAHTTMGATPTITVESLQLYAQGITLHVTSIAVIHTL